MKRGTLTDTSHPLPLQPKGYKSTMSYEAESYRGIL